MDDIGFVIALLIFVLLCGIAVLYIGAPQETIETFGSGF